VSVLNTALKLDADVCAQLPQHVAVAWSGGADSTALLFLLRDAGFIVQAWHIDHGWHHDSAQYADDLATKAAHLGLVFHTRRLEKAGCNIEAQAREGRYDSFLALAEQTGCFDVLLGHHADDQAETVCMRLLQGAGVAGCQGMLKHRQQKNVRLWRPLLHVSRRDIELFLQQQSVCWFDDESNQDITIWRNKIRHKLFPRIKKQGTEPHKLFLRWQTQAVRIQAMIALQGEQVQVLRRVEQDVCCVIDWRDWCGQSAPVRAYVLQKMIGLLFEDGRVFGRRHILAIEQWRKHGGNGWLNLSRCCLYKKGQRLQLVQVAASLRDSSYEG